MTVEKHQRKCKREISAVRRRYKFKRVDFTCTEQKISLVAKTKLSVVVPFSIRFR
jgi:hypothetical protein